MARIEGNRPPPRSLAGLHLSATRSSPGEFFVYLYLGVIGCAQLRSSARRIPPLASLGFRWPARPAVGGGVWRSRVCGRGLRRRGAEASSSLLLVGRWRKPWATASAARTRTRPPVPQVSSIPRSLLPFGLVSVVPRRELRSPGGTV